MSDSTPPPNPYQSASQLSPSDEKMWSVIVHVLGIFFQVVPALVGYLVFKDRGPFVRQHTTAALNFQLTMLIAYVIGGVLSLILIGYFIIFAVAIVTLVFSILAAIAANNGQTYKYPLTYEFIK
jgi:uncharacterized Tic20 family protein